MFPHTEPERAQSRDLRREGYPLPKEERVQAAYVTMGLVDWRLPTAWKGWGEERGVRSVAPTLLTLLGHRLPPEAEPPTVL